MGTGIVYRRMIEAEERLLRERVPLPRPAARNETRRGIGMRMRNMSARLFGAVGNAPKQARPRTT